MARIELDINTPLSPEQVIGGLTDFSERRPEIWPGIDPGLYEVHSVGDTRAKVKEGSRAPGMTVWAVEDYDWSVPGIVSWTIRESNLFASGGSVSARVEPDTAGGSRIHVTWNRTGAGLKGRMLVGVIKLSGGRPVSDSIRQGLERMLESERQP